MNLSRWVVSVVALAGLLAACGGGGDDGAPAAATVPARAGAADITPAGGSVDAVLDGGATVRLEVPAGALASTTTLRIDPTPGPSGTLGAFTLSPAGITLLKPVSLVVTLPPGLPPDRDTSLLFDTGARLLPLGQTIDLSTRTIVVQLDALTLQATDGALATAAKRSQALVTRTAAASGASFMYLLQPGFGFFDRVGLLQAVVSDLAAQGSNQNAINVRVVMEAVLGDPRGSTEPLVHDVTPTWRNVVCGQQHFFTSALNTFAGVDIQTFEQRAKDVAIWNRHALDLNALDARLSPAEPGCAGVPPDVLDPVRVRLPTFLADVRQALNLLDPTVAADYTQLFGVRFADMLNLAADFGLVGATDLESATFGVVVSEMVRVRDVAYTECRVKRNQTVQSKLLKEALLSEARSPFQRDDVLQDVQFCGMPLHWKLVDGQGVVMQQGNAGGTGPGATVASLALQAGGAAKIVFSGPLSALICPVGSQNNEQLAFMAGPAAGPFNIVRQLNPSNANGYLESATLDIDVQPLLVQGAKRLVVARQGGLCNGEFVTLGGHATLATFTLNQSTLQITTASLPGGTVGTAYAATLAASGGPAPLVWSATGLPAGLALNAATGEISGTPTGAGAASVTVSVTGADGSTAQITIGLVVSAATVVPDVTGTYVGTHVDNTTGLLVTSSFTVVVRQSGNRVHMFGNSLFELAPSGNLTLLGAATTNDDFVVDPNIPIKVTFTGGFVGNTLAFRVAVTPARKGTDDDSFILVKQ